jgi:Cu(I)/Ag(I) efflux system membrane protein CusA/SilA
MPIDPEHRPVSPLDHLVRSCLHNRLVVMVVTLLVIFWGLYVAPFDWHLGGMPRDPVPVDAIPDIGENQQIVFTEWMGRSPQDVEDQISYPLTVSLLGVPGVKSIRSYSMFGFSTIYVIFNEEMDFYWARSRLLEKLNSLAPGALPPDVQPVLGPDATALGQIYWYTLEGRDQDGNVTGGWSLQELRSIQDWTVRYALMAVAGVSEVASVGGFVKEYQVDVDPHALRIYDISIEDVFRAVRMSNLDVGARTIELNQAEYIVRGVGFIRSVEDLEQAVVAVHDNSPVRLRDVAQVALGPALRRGALDRGGVETVGGVVVARFGENPLAVLNRLHDRIGEVAPGLPEKVIVDFDRATPGQVRAFAQRHGFDAFNNDGTLNRPAWLQWARRTAPERYPGWLTWSKVRIVPFYDRSGLIRETLATLNTALVRQVLVTIVVILIMVRIMSASLLISGLMPLAILITFVAMKYTGVDANVVALSGIAIAIGTMVDMGIVITENIIRHRREDTEGLSPVTLVYRATREVAGAILTAVTTTVVGFMPVFALQAAEGKLFRPLAYTKTFALMAAMVVAVTVLPVLASFLIARKPVSNDWKNRVPHFPMIGKMLRRSVPVLAVLLVVILLTIDWLPLGPERGLTRNLIFVGVMVAGLLLVFALFRAFYTRMLAWCLVHKRLFTMLPLAVVAFGLLVWTGWGPRIHAAPR